MRKSIRLSLLAAAGVAALALAGSAFAATFKPDLWASNFDPLIGVQALEIAGSPSDVATAKATIFIGKGDVMSVPGGAVGAKIGAVSATAQLRNAGNAIVNMRGNIVVAKASNYVNNPCSAGNHAAVWLLVLKTASGPLSIPVYVDPASGGTEAFASYTAQTCLPSPYIPEDQGGAPLGAQVRRISVELFNFESAVPNRWTAILTPYVEGTGTPNALGTVETQSIVSQAKIANFKAKRVSKGKKKHKRYWAKISGVVRENGHGTAAKVKLYAVGKKKLKLVAQRKSRASGKFTFKKRLKKRTRFVVEAFKPDGHVNPPQCVPDLDLGFGVLPCTSVSTSGFDTFKVTRIFKVPRKH